MIKFLFLLLFFTGCRPGTSVEDEPAVFPDTNIVESNGLRNEGRLAVKDTSVFFEADRREVVDFAKSLLGVPYKYASADPAIGFDCSGFITYVYNNFSEEVPRSSVAFTNLGREVNIHEAQIGDLILFTGTDSSERTVGHMGIVVNNNDSLRFIHSTSGKAWGVTITALNDYYRGRFVKVIDMYRK